MELAPAVAAEGDHDQGGRLESGPVGVVGDEPGQREDDVVHEAGVRADRFLSRPVLDGLIPYDAGLSLEALARQLGRSDLVRLSANENPLGPSPRAVAAVEREAARIHLYPDGGSSALREALGRRLGVGANQIVVGNGADELIALIAAAAFEPGDEVVVPAPSFEPYQISATLAGARVVESPLAGYDT